MKLKYVGNKPIISQSGVDFSIGKEDKYIYIEPAAQMLDFLGKLEKDTKTSINPKKKPDDSEIFELLCKYKPDFDRFCHEQLSHYIHKIDNEIADVDNHNLLGELEKEVLRNNLESMREYRIQRATNKLIYEELINACVEIIREKSITEIIMPFSLPFVHVAESFESSLALISNAIVAKVEVILEDDNKYTKFTVTGFVES
jgi:hypothetical protein